MPQQATIPTKSKNALIVNCTWGNHLPTCLLLLLFRPLPRPREKAIVVNLFVGVNRMVISGYFRFGSKGACLVKIDGKQHISQTDFNFTGTLIDFDIDTQNLEEEDILTDFDF